MFIDEVTISVAAGHGGAGKASFFPGKKAGPDGGNGGKGGDVYFAGVDDITGLSIFSHRKDWKAENGEAGKNRCRTGRNGEDLIIPLPFGTTAVSEKGAELYFEKGMSPFLICRGGKGGKGNYELRSSTNTTPLHGQPGLAGEEHVYHLVLRLIADFGFIGLPNVGKTSLLNQLTAAKAKVADYPFTTLEPNLGVCQGKILADIPGLIKGASAGKGLGFNFLKHIEKVRCLFHCVAADSTTPVEDYLTVREEMKKYNPRLARKKEIIILTKMDLVSESEWRQKVELLEKIRRSLMTVSIFDAESIRKIERLISSH